MTTFADVEVVTVNDLTAGDFVVQVPTQRGVRGAKVNSGIRTTAEDFGTWTRSSGYRRPKIGVESRILMFNDHSVSALNIPLDFIVEVRRIQASS